MRYITITNEPDVAAIYERQGVTDVMIDLENEAKLHRQPEGAWISFHNLDDVSAVRPRLAQTRLIVRVESTEFREADQIDEAVGRGADAVMLPFFFKADEVGLFASKSARELNAFSLLRHQSPRVTLIPYCLIIPLITCTSA